MSDAAADELLELNQQLLESIATGDWETYQELCDPSITAFEPEGRGHLIQGLEFHRFYFDLKPSEGPRTTTMASPKVRLMGDVAVVSRLLLQGSWQKLVLSSEHGHPWRLRSRPTTGFQARDSAQW